MPHLTHDTVPALAQIVLALQTLVSRHIDPLQPAVVSITNVHAGSGATNVIGDGARLSGTVRTFDSSTRQLIRERMETLVHGIAASFSLRPNLRYQTLIDPTVNHPASVEFCRSAATRVTGSPSSVKEMPPVMGGEDFGSFLEHRPGAFIILGQALPDPTSPCSQGLHSPHYDFNDAILPLATEYFADLAESRLPLHL
jgi:hippurate hydrolase